MKDEFRATPGRAQRGPEYRKYSGFTAENFPFPGSQRHSPLTAELDQKIGLVSETIKTVFGNRLAGEPVHTVLRPTDDRLDCLVECTGANASRSGAWKSHRQFLDEVARAGAFNQDAVLTSNGVGLLTFSLAAEESVSRPDWGSWRKATEPPSPGDLWGYWSVPSGDLFLVSDGVGHGPKAEKASRLAARTLEEAPDLPLERFVDRVHDVLVDTRGVVLFVGRLSPERDRLEYCSIGNIAAKLIRPGSVKTLLSANGTVGFTLPDFRSWTREINDESQLLLHTDGVRTVPNDYVDSQFRDRNPLMMSACVLNQFGKGTDDELVATVKL